MNRQEREDQCDHSTMRDWHELCPQCGMDVYRPLTLRAFHETPSAVDGTSQYAPGPHDFREVRGDHVCVICGYSPPDGNAPGSQSSLIDEYQDRIIRKHDVYQPREYLDKKLAMMSGVMETWPWSQAGSSAVRKSVIHAKTWHDVYEIMDRLYMKEVFIAAPVILGHPIKLGNYSQLLMGIIYRRKYRLKVPYVLVKLMILYDDPEDWRWVPFKIKRATHCKNERTWRLVCEDFGWKFQELDIENIEVPWIQKAEDLARQDPS